jgi:hypothetical protein
MVIYQRMYRWVFFSQLYAKLLDYHPTISKIVKRYVSTEGH